MLKKLMFPRDRRVYRLVAATLAVLFVPICAPRCAGQEPTATAVMTDRDVLPASSRFGVPNQFKLTGAGEVFFTSGGNTGLFRWSQPAGIERLLQTNDPLQKLGPTLPEGLLDVTGALLQANAGYAGFIISAAIKGRGDPGVAVVYDGSPYRLSNVGMGTFLQLFLNASGKVAVSGYTSSWNNVGPQRIEVETASGRVRVAETGQPAPASVGGAYNTLQLIGFNDAGWVAFLADIQGNSTTTRAVLLSGNGGPPVLVVKSLDPAPGTTGGTFNLRAGAGNYILNNAGDVAFATDITGDGGQPGIWIGSASQPPAKLMRLSQATETPLRGNFSLSGRNTPFALRGFNDAGRVLFSSNVDGGTSPHALFLKDLSSAAQVVFSKDQSGGPAGNFDTTQQASLNNSGKVAFLATLTGGSSPIGWYLGSGATEPIRIAAQGAGTPLGGTFGLAGRNAPAVLDDGNRVLFLADILGLDAAGLFLWTDAGVVESVVSSRDSLPDGANTVLRAEPAATSDKETLVRILKAGGQAAWYAKPLETGMAGLRKILAEFDQVPDVGAVVSPESFAMNSQGEVEFTAALLAPDSYPRGGILVSRPASGLEKAVVGGDAAPSGGTFASFGPPQFSNQCQVAFQATTTGGQGGIFIASPGQPIQEVIRTGAEWPDGGGSFSGFYNSVAVNESGQVAFRGSRTGATGLFVGTGGGTPIKVAQTGDPVAGGLSVNGFPNSTFKLNAAGQVAYITGVGGNKNAILLGTPGTQGYTSRAIALTGDAAPVAGGGTFGFLPSNFHLNSAGQVAFLAGYSSGAGWFLGSATAPPSLRLIEKQSLPGGGRSKGSVSQGARFAALADSGEMAIYVPEVDDGCAPQFVIVGADGALRKFAICSEKAEGTGGEFGKLYPDVAATPSGKFLFGAVLVNGPAQAGIFINKP